MGVFDALTLIQENEKEAEYKAQNFVHESFVEEFLQLVYSFPDKFVGDVYKPDRKKKDEAQRDEWGNVKRPVEYIGKEIICCPEPITFVAKFRDYSGSQSEDKAVSLMKELIAKDRENFKRIQLDHEPSNGMWFNSTLNGINLRPGLEKGSAGKPYPVTMGDLTVHGVVVGRTGSGKSVFLNNLIFNMLTEYAPWELDLYLADFKKVELSRYMRKYQTPHLKTCAATSEIRYVVSMLNYIVDCMNARNALFSCLGIQKLSDFREKFGVVLPRVILLVDEFQQMFLEATTRESAIINDLLMSIIKLGRSTGFHLLFASQEMSGALSGKALANFKIRFALPCESSVSSDILGNGAAATLERGFVLVNRKSGKADDNEKFKVPYVPGDDVQATEEEEETSYFYGYLKKQSDEAKGFGFYKNKTFYQEDYQLDFKDLEEKVLSNERIKAQKQKILSEKSVDYFDIMTLGRGVVYSDKKHDLETFFIQRGQNRNILAVCPNTDDLSYVQRLLAVNFKHSTLADKVEHRYYGFSPVLSAKYDLRDDLKGVKFYDSVEDLEKVHGLFAERAAITEAAKQVDPKTKKRTLTVFIEGYCKAMGEALGQKKQFEQYEKVVKDLYKDVLIFDIPEKAKEILGMNTEPFADVNPFSIFVDPIMAYYKYVVERKSWLEIFSPIVIWLSGIEYIENIPRWFFPLLRNAMEKNILFLMFTASEDIRFSEYLGRCEYIFASGNNEKVYTKCGMQYTRKSRNSVVIDFKIKGLNTERSFKKYKISASEFVVPSLDFDMLL